MRGRVGVEFDLHYKSFPEVTKKQSRDIEGLNHALFLVRMRPSRRFTVEEKRGGRCISRNNL